jgi:hypothetical protein
MRKRPLFAFLFFILFLNLFIHSQEIPDYPDCKVKVSKIAFKIFGCYPLFKSLYYLEMEEIYKKIDKGLERAYRVAWGNYNTFRNNIKNEDGLPTECIKSAIDSLKNISDRRIELVFTFDRNYWNYYGFGGLDINNYKANKDGNGGFIISRSSPYKIYISNAYNIGFTYKKYKTSYKNCDYKASISHIVMEMPSDKLTEFERKRKEYISKFWEPDGEVKWSLGSLLFHEMVHMSLYHSRSDHNYIKTRFPDEATVEDTTLKIFPSPEKGGMGLNSYDYEYSFSSWAHMKRNIPRDLYFLYDKRYPLARSFNPPVIKEDKDFRYADGTVCDDVRCEDLRKYKKPIRICAKPECPEGGKGGGHGPGRDNADDRYSFSEGIVREYNLAPEAVIFTDGYWQDAIKLYGGLKFNGDNIAEKLLEATPFLVIPSGGLFAKEQDSTFKAILEKYVSLGGTIIVFCQQYA